MMMVPPLARPGVALVLLLVCSQVSGGCIHDTLDPAPMARTRVPHPQVAKGPGDRPRALVNPQPLRVYADFHEVRAFARRPPQERRGGGSRGWGLVGVFELSRSNITPCFRF